MFYNQFSKSGVYIMDEKYLKTHEYVLNKWKDGLREQSNPDYPIPFPFEPPCVNGLFQCLFYWDTFYTNHGMLLDGKTQYAIWNADNLIYLLNKYGCVPNSNSYPGIKHNSQPPYLHFMVADVYAVTKDDAWLKQAYEALKKEYEFWMTKRMTPCGLNQYLHHEKTDQEKIDFYDYVATRLDIDPDAPREVKIYMGSGFNAQGESGLDFSPRLKFEGQDCVEPDLNANLYGLETDLMIYAKKFEPEMVEVFAKARAHRKELMDKYLLNKEDGLYYDYNFVKGEIVQTEFCFTGQFMPFITGVSKDKKACQYLLSKVEFDGGVASTGLYDSDIEYQASYPFSWPYDNALAFWALTTLGLKEEYTRVGTKYLNQCANSYMETKHLWETYSAITGDVASKKEYANGEMLGWTGGTYQWIYYYLFENKEIKTVLAE